MANITLDIVFKRPSRTFRAGDDISGTIIITAAKEFTHDGVFLSMDGTVVLQAGTKPAGFMDAIGTTGTRTIPLISWVTQVTRPGRVPPAKTEIPFTVPLRTDTGQQLYETYHGVRVRVQYFLRCEIRRSLLAQKIVKSQEVYVENPRKAGGEVADTKHEFTMTPETIKNVKDRGRVPDFAVRGSIRNSVCALDAPVSGHLVVERSERKIRSIELQLLRVEFVGTDADSFVKDSSEIQNIQIVEGDVMRRVDLPLHMVLPRFFACPSLNTSSFKLAFELNLLVIFQDNCVVAENIPVILQRSL